MVRQSGAEANPRDGLAGGIAPVKRDGLAGGIAQAKRDGLAGGIARGKMVRAVGLEPTYP
ncbi:MULTISPECIES: hypothetical protein [Xanthobacter]|uniref:hypothetical protein n=1 Tax=Xanthobacter TaxID=279 RepID=UPI0035B2C34B